VILFDVNVLVAAHRAEHEHHALAARLLRETVATGEPLALTSTVTVALFRLVTNARIFTRPSAPALALAFLQALHDLPQAVRVEAGPQHWATFRALCEQADVRGGLATDAHLAALAVESGSTLVSFDRDFARFEGLRWRHPSQSTV
jgi:toxin-antitoxin system PIN domain toxin